MRSIKSLHLNNTYYLMRHGESEKNILDINNYNPSISYSLTEKGKATAVSNAEQFLKDASIDAIFVSPLSRTKETVDAVKTVIGDVETFIENGLTEVDSGIYGERPTQEYQDFMHKINYDFTQLIGSGESLEDVQARMLAVLELINKTYLNKRILIVSHGDPLWLLRIAREGITSKDVPSSLEEQYISTGEVYELS